MTLRKIIYTFSLCSLLLLIVFIGTPSLPEGGSSKRYSFSEAVGIVARENDVIRSLYTRAIVGEGKKQGLQFDEHWRNQDVEAGPLPALFLRGVSDYIQQEGVVPLGLFLGSDFPIRESNRFVGMQEQLFDSMHIDAMPKFFFDENTLTQTAMFPDFAVASSCVSCHNSHKETSKKDWKLGDLMGATTWTYPEDSLSYDELLALIKAYRNGVQRIYDSYLTKVESFDQRPIPQIGDRWPGEGGLYLPSSTVFMDSISRMTSEETLKAILR